LFQTTQGEFIVPVQPDMRLAMKKAETLAIMQEAEQIKGIIPLVFPPIRIIFVKGVREDSSDWNLGTYAANSG